MCGIVGLFLRTPRLEERLGELVAPMLDCMSTRGPDSAGIAIYDDPPVPGASRFSVRLPAHWISDTGIDELIRLVSEDLQCWVGCQWARPDGAVVTTSADSDRFADALHRHEPAAVIVGSGRHIEVIKDVGRPGDICRRYDVAQRRGYQAIGHTRMATESAVTVDHSHPFTPIPDLALVHNGSFSNPATVRRRLEDDGIRFRTDNDSEVAARLIGQELTRGAPLEVAFKQIAAEMDGFYTLLASSATEFAVVRDSFACKPLVVAEADEYVAVASEYIAMTELPGIEQARVFEPMPQDVHVWGRSR